MHVNAFARKTYLEGPRIYWVISLFVSVSYVWNLGTHLNGSLTDLTEWDNCNVFFLVQLSNCSFFFSFSFSVGYCTKRANFDWVKYIFTGKKTYCKLALVLLVTPCLQKALHIPPRFCIRWLKTSCHGPLIYVESIKCKGEAVYNQV